MDVQDTKLISLSMAYTQVSGQLSLCFVFFYFGFDRTWDILGTYDHCAAESL